MTLEVIIPDVLSSQMPSQGIEDFRAFLQQVCNRRIAGWLRYEKPHYGRPMGRHRYQSRLRKELEVYDRTGNFEQLLNIAVYAFLESEAPENRRFHFNPQTTSVTRKEFGI